MMSLTDVTCPHCGAHGQIMTPPQGAIIVGPCPQCNDMVVLFCGRVLPLNSDTIKNKPTEEKKNHLMAVLGKFLEERIDFLFDTSIGETEDDVMAQEQDTTSDCEACAPQQDAPATITAEEFSKFVQVDLPLLDNPDYFRSVFG